MKIKVITRYSTKALDRHDYIARNLGDRFNRRYMFDEDIKVSSWNARGLFQFEPCRRKHNIAKLVRIARKSHVTFVQESHGCIEDIEGLASRMLSEFVINGSVSNDSRSGGVLIVLRKEFADI